MSAKAILIFCAQALFVQAAFSQCLGRGAIGVPGLAPGVAAPYGLTGPLGLAAPGFAAPYGLASPCGWSSSALDFTPTSGGGLPVSSASAAAPVGISIASENVYEGALYAIGELPFVGTVGLEGVLPTAGAGAVNHACGNGVNAMISEGGAYAPGYAGAYAPYGAAAIAPGLGLGAPALGYAGWAGRGYGYAI